jgi:hypothetical protein
MSINARPETVMGFAALYPSYGVLIGPDSSTGGVHIAQSGTGRVLSLSSPHERERWGQSPDVASLIRATPASGGLV